MQGSNHKITNVKFKANAHSSNRLGIAKRKKDFMSFLNSTATSPLGYLLSAYTLWGQIKLKIKCVLIHVSESFNLLFYSLSHANLN